VLGISVDATEKEKARNISRSKAFLAANKQVRFDSDISLPIEVERTLETIQDAESKIQQPNGRLRHAHLWFWDGNPVDSKALQLIRDNAPNKGVTLLLRNVSDKDISPRNYSSYRNIAIYYLSMLGPGMELNQDVAAAGLKFFGKFIQSDYFEKFSQHVLGDNAFLDKEDAIQDLCGLIFKPFKKWIDEGKIQVSEFIQWIDDFPENAKKDLKNRFIDKPLQELTEAIKQAEDAIDDNPASGHYAGKKLIEKAKPLLNKLEQFLGKTDYRYESAAEDTALKIRSCCFAFWNDQLEKGDSDPESSCLYLSKSAYKLCPNGKTGDLLKNDIEQIKEYIAGAAVRGDFEFIIRLLEKYKNASGSSLYSQASSMLREAKSRLHRIRDVKGRNNDEYLKMSTVVASCIVGMLIEYANDYASTATEYNKIKNKMSEVGDLDMESHYKAHWSRNLEIVSSNASTGSVYSSSSSGGSGCLVAIVCVFVIGFIINLFNSDDSSKSNSRSSYNNPPANYSRPATTRSSSYNSTPANTTRVTAPSRSYNLIPQTTPRHGKVLYESGEKVAPFKIKVPYGDNNYYVKLEDWFSGRKIMVFFVNGRSINHTLDVPTGTFRLKYASGETWYGEKDLFGPNTSYNQANSRMTFEILGNRVSGHTVELIKQVGGNLRTSSLKSANF
jgi:hypothetical protein